MADYTIKKIQDIYQGKLINIVLKEVTFPDGKSASREVVVHPGSVGIIPFIDDEHVILIEQFRTAAEQVLWEIPAGTLEKNESPIECARRELIEETGYRADRIKKLACFFLSPGYSTEMMHLFAAYNLTEMKQELEEDERLETRILSCDDVNSLFQRGEIIDAKTITGLSMVNWLHG